MVALRCLVYALLAVLVRTEERSIMDQCSTVPFDKYPELTTGSNASCDSGFKSYFHTTGNIVAPNGAKDKEVTTRLASAKTVLNVFVLTDN